MTDGDRDTAVFGAAAVLLLVGALSGSVPALLVSVVAGWFAISRTAPRGGLLAAFATALVWANASVVLGERLGMPAAVALAPQALLGLLFLGRLVVGRTTVVATPAFRALLLYGAVVLASGLTADFAGPVLDRYLTFLAEGLLLWFLIINVIHDRRALERVLTALVVVAGFLGAVTVFQFATETFTQDYAGFGRIDADEQALLGALDDYTPRLSASTGEKNRFAQLMVVTFPIAISLARRRRRLAAAVHIISTVLIIGGIAVSGSRGAALGVVATVAVLAVLRVISVRAVVGVAVAAALTLVVLPEYRERVVSSVDVATSADGAGAVDGSTLSRITELVAALHMFVDHPFLGVGPGGYPPQYEAYAERIGLNVREGPREAHNLYLGVAAELGFAGLLAFLAIFAVLLRRLHAVRRAALAHDDTLADLAGGMTAAIVAYLATGVFLHLSFERYLWLILAVADAAARVLAMASSSPPPLDPSQVASGQPLP